MNQKISTLSLTILLCLLTMTSWAQDCLSFDVHSAEAPSGQQVCIDVTTNNFEDLVGFQYSINWDASVLEFESLQNLNTDIGLTANQFGTPDGGLDPNQLSVSWLDATIQGQTLTDGAVLFSICFNMLGGTSEITFSTSPTAIEVLDTDLEEVSASFTGGQVTSESSEPLLRLDQLCASGPLSCLSAEAAITATVSGGTLPYDFLWFSPNGNVLSNGGDVIVSEPGFYTLNITDASGATVSGMVEVKAEIEADLIADVLIERPTCPNGNDGIIWLTPNGNVEDFTFLWNNGASAPAINGLAPGNYSVTITNTLSGCTVIENYLLEEEDFITATSYACEFFDDTTMVTISTIVWAGGVPPYTFEWSNGETETSDNGIGSIYVGAGPVYAVTITDQNGCERVYDNLIPPCEQSGNEDLTLNVESVTANVGENVCVDITVEQFEGIIGFQGSLSWNAALLDFSSITTSPNLPGDINFGINGLVENGQLSYSWIDQMLVGQSLNDGDVLFTVCYEALAGGSSAVNISNTPTPVQFIDNNNETIDVTYNNGSVTINGDDELIVGVSYECQFFGDGSVIVTVSSISWNGTAPFVFEWSTGEVDTTDFLAELTLNDANATFGLTVTDANGLTYEADNLQVDCGSTNTGFVTGASCETTVYQSGNIEAELTFTVFSGGVAPYEFTWSDGQFAVDDSMSTITYLCPGASYNLTVTDAEGTVEEFFNVNSACDCGNIGGDGEVMIRVGNETGEVGGQVCVPVIAEQFEDILSMQYTLNYDPSVLEYQSMTPVALTSFNSSNIANINPGTLTTAWVDVSLQGITLNPEDVLYEICFDIVGAEGSMSNIAFGNTPTPIEFTDLSNEELVFSVTDGSVTVLENVWPGDTDNSELVTNVDLLNIGLGYGQVGPARTSPTTDWVGQPAADWDTSTPLTGINFKNADCNGDGIIDAVDANAILDNYGEETNFWDGGSEEEFADTQNNLLESPPIFILPDTVLPGAMVEFPIIMGDEDFPADNIYGVAFSILYDPEVVVPESAFASFTESWVGMIDDNLLGLYMDFHAQGRIDVALTKTDGINVSGSGQIGTLHLTIEDVILRSTYYPVSFDIVDIKVINFGEEEIPVTPKETTVVIDVINNTQQNWLEEMVAVYPNPTNNQLNIDSEQLEIINIELYQLDGQQVPLSVSNARVLSLGGLAGGVYLLKVQTDKGVLHKRIVKQGMD